MSFTVYVRHSFPYALCSGCTACATAAAISRKYSRSLRRVAFQTENGPPSTRVAARVCTQPAASPRRMRCALWEGSEASQPRRCRPRLHHSVRVHGRVPSSCRSAGASPSATAAPGAARCMKPASGRDLGPQHDALSGMPAGAPVLGHAARSLGKGAIRDDSA